VQRFYRASGGISRMASITRECEKKEGRDTILSHHFPLPCHPCILIHRQLNVCIFFALLLPPLFVATLCRTRFLRLSVSLHESIAWQDRSSSSDTFKKKTARFVAGVINLIFYRHLSFFFKFILSCIFIIYYSYKCIANPNKIHHKDE
jgi:hypothetical protein